MQQADEDLYELLQVSPSAEPDVIEAAFRRLAFRHHPDRNAGSPEAAERMKALNSAYDLLSDPVRRAEYDRRRAAGRSYEGSRRAAGRSHEGSRHPTVWPRRAPTRPRPTETPAAPPPPPLPRKPPVPADFGLTEPRIRLAHSLVRELPVWLALAVFFASATVATMLLWPTMVLSNGPQLAPEVVSALGLAALIGLASAALVFFVVLRPAATVFQRSVGILKRANEYEQALAGYNREWNSHQMLYWRSLEAHEVRARLLELLNQCGFSISLAAHGEFASSALALAAGTTVVADTAPRVEAVTLAQVRQLHALVPTCGATHAVVLTLSDSVAAADPSVRVFIADKPIYLLSMFDVIDMERSALDRRTRQARAVVQRPWSAPSRAR